jgi:diguanylate cyclase (GGDEF)-like protein
LLHLRKTFLEYIFVVITVLVALLITAWAAASRHEAAKLKLAQTFQIAASDRINVINRTLQNNIAVTHSIVSFFNASDTVSRSEFSIFSAQILKEYPYIEALEWAPRIQAGQRGFYEALGRESVPGFMFKDFASNDAFTLSEARDLYYPVFYIAPISDSTMRVFGVDFMTNPVRRQAMEAAISTRSSAMTAKVQLVSSHQPGVLFFSPVFKNNELQGFVIAAVPLEEMVAAAIEPLNKEGVNIIAHDVTDFTAPNEPLFIHASRLKPASNEEVMSTYNAGGIRREAVITVANRQWRITIVPSEGYFEVPRGTSSTVLLIGVLFTIAVGYFMLVHIRENIRITGIVRERTKELEQLARYDALTGLANRRLFMDLLRQALARASRSRSKVGVIYIDLNDFKPINDKLGHAAGDALLQEFGSRLGKTLREYDTLARLGGDEFAILADRIHTPSDYKAPLTRLLEAMGKPYTIFGNEVTVSASIGLALYPDHGTTLDDVLAAADSAMYEAKKDKGRPYVIYTKPATPA